MGNEENLEGFTIDDEVHDYYQEIRDEEFDGDAIVYDVNNKQYLITCKSKLDGGIYFSIPISGIVDKDNNFMQYSFEYLENMRNEFPGLIIECDEDDENGKFFLSIMNINILNFEKSVNKDTKKYYDNIFNMAKKFLKKY